MRSIGVTGGYGLTNVAIKATPLPSIQENEVLVNIKSLSLNQLDLMVANGAFKTPLPHTLGSDAAGNVVKIGSKVKSLQIGDFVTSHFIHKWQTGSLMPNYLNSRLGTNAQGVFSEFVALPEQAWVKSPTNLNADEASTLPIAGLTAWEAIVNKGKLNRGQTVLLQGTGGVSIMALQFSKAIGAKVIITSSSNEKLLKANLLGANHTINYATTPNWHEKIMDITNGKGVDLALEMSWAEVGKTIQATKLGGKIAIVGLLGGATTELSVFGIMQRSLSITGIQVGSKQSFIEMNKAIETYNIKPVIDKTYSVEQLNEALDYFEKGKHFGKIILRF